MRNLDGKAAVRRSGAGEHAMIRTVTGVCVGPSSRRDHCSPNHVAESEPVRDED